MPPVKRRCQRCERVTLSRLDWSRNRVVGPRGIMHLADPHNPGRTLCGKNGAGANYESWWWEL
jgi:hypothetical protein